MNRAQVPVFGTGGNRAQVPVDGTGANQAQFPVLEPGGNRVQAPISGTGGNQRPDDQVEDSKAVLCWTKHGEFRCTARSKTTDKRYMFTKIPIQEPLLRLQNSELTELILECFVCIMKFMGDYPMKDNQTEYDCVLRILRTCHNYPELTDEIYCQLCKQMTNNRNMKSCVLGWRLFSIVACYSDCSYKLWPHLKAYIETTSSDTSSTFSKPASICLHNLQQTKKYGGRQNIPTKPEITALSDGRLTQRYTFTFRGSETQGMLQVGPSMVVRDAVEDICNRLDIFDQVEMEEYTLSICTKGETTPQFVGLKSEEYILDVTGEMVRRNQEFSLVFQRIVWLFPYRETDNILYNKLMFFQCLPDYSDGRLVQNRHLSGLVEEDVALLGALLYKAFDRGDMPTIQDLPSLLPNVVRQLPGYHPSPWLHKIQRHMTTANRLGPLNCMAKFVAILSRWTLFGSTFFAVEEPMIGHCILMVNKNGLHALHSNTHIPIQEPLLRLQNSELTELILECFVCIMKFMGDYPMKDNQTEYDCVLRILRTCHNYPELTDEIYCQLCKQMTNNRNMKSCVLGWRLFSIVACYSDCSYKLWPHLKAYIETTSSDTSSTFSKPASICLHNLQQTKKYGGRQNIPTKPEITALSDGRLTQRYTFTFRGSETQGMLQVGPSMVVRDAVEDICNRLDIFDQVEMEEYTLSICTKGETTPQFVGLKSEEYILDVTGEMVRRNQEFSLVFQRIVWLFPYRETDNILYNKLMFFQCLPDYSDGRLVQNRHLSGLVEEDVALLGALLYKAFDRGDMPTIQDLPSLLPNVVRQLPGYHPSPWLHKIQRHMTTANRLGPLNCMAKFVAILSRWTLFGSTFFAVEEPMIGHCILMVNKNGLHALHSNTHSTWIKMVTSKVDGAPMVKSVYTSMYATERE